MEKLLFLVPDAATAEAVVATLRRHGLSDDEIGVLANEEAHVQNLPDAAVEDSSDVIPAFARGVAAGGATGLVAGLAALAFPPVGLAVAGGAALVATTALGGASFGAFASVLVGSSVDNSQLRDYEDAIRRGEILVIVDVKEEGEEEKKRRVGEIRNALAGAHPSLSFEGAKDDTPPPAI